VDELSKRFSDLNWDIVKDPLVGTVRPDMVVAKPEKTAVVVELKFGKEVAHIGDLARVAAAKAAYAQMNPDQTTTAVYVTSNQIGEGFRKAAEALGVTIVSVEPPDSPEAVSSKLVQSVSTIGGRSQR
jgi:hypothetical protein